MTTQGHTFNWPLAIARNRDALLRVVAVLFVYAGLDEGGADAVPRRVWRMVLRLLRPAESAARRLIVIAARGIEVAPPKSRAEKPLTGIERLVAAGVLVFHEVNLGLARAPQPQPAATTKSAPAIRAFPLTDPPRRFDPRDWDGLRPFPKDGFDLADEDEEVSARHLCRRLLALKAALDDLPRHARRLARHMARRDAGLSRAIHVRPLRLGHPPGHRRNGTHAVDGLLSECHSLALQAIQRGPPATSPRGA